MKSFLINNNIEVEILIHFSSFHSCVINNTMSADVYVQATNFMSFRVTNKFNSIALPYVQGHTRTVKVQDLQNKISTPYSNEKLSYAAARIWLTHGISSQ